jgi:hypothetical protein
LPSSSGHRQQSRILQPPISARTAALSWLTSPSVTHHSRVYAPAVAAVRAAYFT